MYIFELIGKLRKDYKEGKGIFSKKAEVQKSLDDEYAACEHIFVPIDSTKKVLACSKCGFILHREDINKINKGIL